MKNNEEVDKKKSVIEVLHDIQSTIQVPKTRYNKFGDFYYRNYEDIIEAVKPMLCGCILTATDEVLEKNGAAYVRATLCLTDGRDKICVSAEAREEIERPKMSTSQLTGSASSYARKYAANGLFLLDDVKDDDNIDTSKKAKEHEQTKNNTAQETKPVVQANVELGPLCTKHNVNYIKRTGKYGVHYSHKEPTEDNGWCNMSRAEMDQHMATMMADDAGVPDPTDEF